MPKPADTVSVNYRGTLIDGTEFDSSKPGQPATFQVTGVIPGWTEALEHMKAGSKWKLFIPSSLAYGERGHLPKIPPSAALIFEVELVSVKPAPAAAAIAKPATSGRRIRDPAVDQRHHQGAVGGRIEEGRQDRNHQGGRHREGKGEEQ